MVTTQPLRVGMIETTVNVILHREMYDPTLAGWDDWNMWMIGYNGHISDPAIMGWDDWNFRYNASASSVQDQPPRVGMIETRIKKG